MDTFFSRIEESMVCNDTECGQHESNNRFFNVLLDLLLSEDRTVKLYTDSKPEKNKLVNEEKLVKVKN